MGTANLFLTYSDGNFSLKFNLTANLIKTYLVKVKILDSDGLSSPTYTLQFNVLLAQIIDDDEK